MVFQSVRKAINSASSESFFNSLAWYANAMLLLIDWVLFGVFMISYISFFSLVAKVYSSSSSDDDELENTPVLVLAVFSPMILTPTAFLYWFTGNWIDTHEMVYGDDYYDGSSKDFLTLKNHYISDINVNMTVMMIQVLIYIPRS